MTEVAIGVAPVAATAPAAWRDYLTLTKPRIMVLLVLTAVGAMVAAAGGDPAPLPLAGLVLGGALACGGASALNHVLDADIDRLMGPRTAGRPVAAGRVSPRRAVAFGLALSVLSAVVMITLDSVLVAGLALAGNAFYVLVYTAWLKRSTPQNIVIGGAAGAVPPLAGWAAGDGRVGLGGLLLFAIVLLWTPPHFWALAVLLERPYAAAKVPMMPVVRGTASTADQVLVYSVALTVLTVLPTALGVFGAFYLAAAAALDGVLLWLAWRMRRAPVPARASPLFHYSLLYLALLFVAVAVDAVVR